MQRAIKLKHLILSNIVLLIIVISGTVVMRGFAAPNDEISMQGLSSDVLSYQGTLLDNNGDPIDGNQEIKFSIYNHPTNLTALWEEVHSGENSVPIQDGVFDVFLGSLNPIPESVWNNSELFLGIKVGNDPEMEPREKITAVPMALTVPDGSISSAKIEDGAIISSSVALTHGFIQGSGAVLYLNSTQQTVPSLSFSVSPTTEQILHLSTTLDFSVNDSCVTGIARVFVDDNPEGTLMTLGGDARATISSSQQILLSPGFHTINIKAWCEASGSGSVMTGQSNISYFLFSN